MISRALKLTTARLVLQQLATAAAVALLFLAWLRIPDSRWFYVAITLLATALLIAIAGAGQTRILCLLTRAARAHANEGVIPSEASRLHREAQSRNLGISEVPGAPTTPTRTTYLRGTLILLVTIALWFAWSTLLAHISLKYDDLWAGYLNSRFPHSLRNLFSYPHLQWLFSAFWTLLTWIGTGILAVLAFHLIATPAPKPAIRRNLRSLTWWLTFLLLTWFIPWLTAHVTNWTPGHGIGIETLSLILRLTTITLVDAILIVFLQATIATFTTTNPVAKP